MRTARARAWARVGVSPRAAVNASREIHVLDATDDGGARSEQEDYIGRRICRHSTVKLGCAFRHRPHSSTLVSSAILGNGDAHPVTRTTANTTAAARDIRT